MHAITLRYGRLSRRNPEAVEFAFLLLLLVAVTLWQSLVVRAYGLFLDFVPAWPDAPFVFGSFLAYVLGTGAAAVVYARVRGVEIPLSLPARRSLPAVALAVFAPPALVIVVVLVGNATGLDVTARSMTQSSYGAAVHLAFLARVTLLPAVLSGVGLALLFHGAVQGTLRQLVDPDHAAALTTLVAALFFLFGPVSVRDPATLFVAFIGAAVLAAVGYGIGLAYAGATTGSVRAAFEGRDGVAVAVVATVGVLTLLGNVDGIPDAVYLCLLVTAVGVGAHAYERTRSIWVPAVALAAFRVSMGIAAYVESVPGAVGL